MLPKWLICKEQEPCPYRFKTRRVTELTGCTDAVIAYLAEELLNALTDPGMVMDECQKLLNASAETGLERIREYIENHVIPSTAIVRIGCFGEVVASRILIGFNGYWLPIYKLRFREKRDWAMRLTDLCLIKKDGTTKPTICFGEVKTKSTGKRQNDLGIKGLSSLKKDNALDDPEIIRFIKARFWDMKMIEEYHFFSNLSLGLIEYGIQHMLFLVHNSDSWSETILERLNGEEIDDELKDFTVVVVLVKKLDRIIEATFQKIPVLAQEIADEQE